MNIMKLIVVILIAATSGVLSIPVSQPHNHEDGDNHEHLRLLRETGGVDVPAGHAVQSPTDPAKGDLDTADTFIGLYGGWGGFGGYGGYGYGYPYGGYGGYGYPYGGYGYFG